MIKEIFTQLEGDIASGISELELVAQYRGEFEEGTNWNPRATACFLQLIGYKPIVKHSDGSTGKAEVSFKVYAGANIKLDKNPMDVTEAVINLLNGTKLTVESTGKTYTLSIMADGMEYISYNKGFEAYAFTLSVI